MMLKKFFCNIVTLLLTLSLLTVNVAAAGTIKTPTLESELHKYTAEPIIASTKGDYAIPIYQYMTINTRMNGALSNTLPFFATPSTSTCNNNKLGDIPHLTTVYVYAVTSEKIGGYHHWAIIDYNGTFGFVSARWVEDSAAMTSAPEQQAVAPTTSPEKPSQTMNITEYAAEVLRLVNVEREKAGLTALAEIPNLSAAATQRANELIQVFSHTRPDGRASNTVTADFGLDCNYQGENIAAGYRTPADVVNGWMNSSGHKANILDANFRYLGVGVAVADNGRIYWTQSFVGTCTSTTVQDEQTSNSKISYPSAKYFQYGGGEDIQYNNKGEIIKVTYYLTDGSIRGRSEFKRAVDYFDFVRTDYWYEKGELAYYVVNELDVNGNEKVAYFYYPNGKLFDTIRD